MTSEKIQSCSFIVFSNIKALKYHLPVFVIPIHISDLPILAMAESLFDFRLQILRCPLALDRIKLVEGCLSSPKTHMDSNPMMRLRVKGFI